ncbi:type II secretion system protein [Candidatus Saccharibacteria bacterium]|nr:type II secretion system protein [Candidatus Saccharibacteria bacterium]
MPKNYKTKQGFTIIEVVLVLAVAGLIFLMVFIALPSLQRTQRDTQRRQDMSRLSAALVQYQTNNNKKADNLPAAKACALTENDLALNLDLYSTNSACKFVKDYLNSATADENSFLDPDGAPYQVGISGNLVSDTGNAGSNFGTAAETKLTCSDSTTGKVCTITGTKFEDHAVFIIPGGKCGGEDNQVVTSQRRRFAILMKLEGARYACLDNE